MKALVTGATGLLGNNLVRTLLEGGAEVRAMSTSAATSRALANLDVERIEADIRDDEAVARANNQEWNTALDIWQGMLGPYFPAH